MDMGRLRRDFDQQISQLRQNHQDVIDSFGHQHGECMATALQITMEINKMLVLIGFVLNHKDPLYQKVDAELVKMHKEITMSIIALGAACPPASINNIVIDDATKARAAAGYKTYNQLTDRTLTTTVNMLKTIDKEDKK